MRKYCIVAAPGVSLAVNGIAGNRCLDPTPAAAERR
jgi:hypothetical protein